jgi:antirestriction protein
MPRIYIACLAAYNDGRLHGRWSDATDAEEIGDTIATVLRTSPIADAEEWAIHDHDGFGDLIGEYEAIERVAELGAAIEQHGPAFLAYAAHVGKDYASAADFQEHYVGEYDSEEAYAEELADEHGRIAEDPPWPLSYIDWGRAARDLFINDYWSASSPRGVYVFTQ